MNIKHYRGFTLIELSIVLVIIGLLVGGVLAGQQLIKSSQALSAISQIQKYNQAANTFRTKFNALPGDLPEPDRTNFGFSVSAVSAPVRGNGNGVIGQMSFLQTNYREEFLLFWSDLSRAKLIDTQSTYPYYDSASNLFYPVNSVLPPSKLGGDKYVYVWSGGVVLNNVYQDFGQDKGLNFFGIAPINGYGVTNTLSAYLTTPPVISVALASAIDAKMDDGLAQSGSVTAS